MTELEFHTQRRMFVVADGTILLAPRNCPLTHAQWLTGLLGLIVADQWLRVAARGYVLGNRLVLYKDADFSPHVDQWDVLTALDLFRPLLGGQIKVVGLGATPGPANPWEPKRLLDAEELFWTLVREQANLNSRIEKLMEG